MTVPTTVPLLALVLKRGVMTPSTRTTASRLLSLTRTPSNVHDRSSVSRVPARSGTLAFHVSRGCIMRSAMDTHDPSNPLTNASVSATNSRKVAVAPLLFGIPGL